MFSLRNRTFPKLLAILAGLTVVALLAGALLA